MHSSSKNSSQSPFITNLQTHISSLFHNLSDPNPSSLKAHLQLSIHNLQKQANQTLQFALSHFPQTSPQPPFTPPSVRTPCWASTTASFSTHRRMSTETIEERLAGVPVYALSNSAEEFVLVSGVRTGKSLGLFCFKREDADALLEQMKDMDPAMRQGSKVVPVALNKVFQLKVDGVAFRFIPDSQEIINALNERERMGNSTKGFSGVPVFQERERMGNSTKGFSGVPVFQSRSLILSSQNKRYRPVFFKKEDLERSLSSASQQQNYLNPALRRGDIQVCVLEEIIKDMKESSESKWDDVVFIPPGFDISTGAIR